MKMYEYMGVKADSLDRVITKCEKEFAAHLNLETKKVYASFPIHIGNGYGFLDYPDKMTNEYQRIRSTGAMSEARRNFYFMYNGGKNFCFEKHSIFTFHRGFIAFVGFELKQIVNVSFEGEYYNLLLEDLTVIE